MLKGWDKQFPGRLETIFTSLQNVAPSQLADAKLFDFAGLQRGGPSEDAPMPLAQPVMFDRNLARARTSAILGTAD